MACFRTVINSFSKAEAMGERARPSLQGTFPFKLPQEFSPEMSAMAQTCNSSSREDETGRS